MALSATQIVLPPHTFRLDECPAIAGNFNVSTDEPVNINSHEESAHQKATNCDPISARSHYSQSVNRWNLFCERETKKNVRSQVAHRRLHRFGSFLLWIFSYSKVLSQNCYRILKTNLLLVEAGSHAFKWHRAGWQSESRLWIGFDIQRDWHHKEVNRRGRLALVELIRLFTLAALWLARWRFD